MGVPGGSGGFLGGGGGVPGGSRWFPGFTDTLIKRNLH